MKWIVDRIEEAHAVCFPDDNESVQIIIPLGFLPEGLEEGDHLSVHFEIDRESAEKERQKAEEMLKELTKKEDRGRKKFKL